jgi:hypothetical protein
MGLIDAGTEYVESVLDSSPSAYWRLNETSGATTFGDTSGSLVYDQNFAQKLTAVPDLTITNSTPGKAVLGTILPSAATLPNSTPPSLGTIAGQPGPQSTPYELGPIGVGVNGSGTMGAGARINTPVYNSFGDSGNSVAFSGVSRDNASPLAATVRIDSPGKKSMSVECWFSLIDNPITGGSDILNFIDAYITGTTASISTSSPNGYTSGQTSITSRVSIPRGSTISVDAGAIMETFVVSSVAGTSNPYTLNFASFSSGTSTTENHTYPAIAAYAVNLRAYIANGNLYIQLAGTGGIPSEVSGGQPITLGQWYHLAIQRVYDSSTNQYFAAAYVNGRQVSGTAVNSSATNQVTWGRINVGGYEYGGRGFPGNVAHVALYNRVLSQDEIVSRYWHGNRGGAGETTTRRAFRFLNRYFGQRFQVEGTTTVTTAVTAGTNTIQVASTLGFKTGEKVILSNQSYSDTGYNGVGTGMGTTLISSYNAYNAELLTISSMTSTSITFTETLAKAHDVGDFVMSGTQLSANAAVMQDTKLLQVIQDLEVAEQGRFFVKADGRPYFQKRSNRIKDPTTAQRLNCNQLNNHGIPYMNPTEWDYDPTMVYNKIVVTRSDTQGSTVFSRKDTTSISKYFLRPMNIDLPIASNTEAKSTADALLAWYANPKERVADVKIDLYAAPQYAAKILGLELGDYIYISKFMTSSQGSFGEDLPMVVEHISIDSGPGVLIVSLRLSPALDPSYLSVPVYDMSLDYH